MDNVKIELDGLLKKAIKENDVLTKNIIRQLRSKVSEYCYTQNMPRNTSDDKVWTKVILTYQKSISKALDMIKRSEMKNSLIETYEFEVDFCGRFLPKIKTEKETEEIVKSAIEELDTDNIGKVMGHIMKNSQLGTLDARMVKRLVSEMVG